MSPLGGLDRWKTHKDTPVRIVFGLFSVAKKRTLPETEHREEREKDRDFTIILKNNSRDGKKSVGLLSHN